eukprot:TRINITY_DN240_c0_g1_i1.p2 TRINITY_DN240_c0_g1~~TRINITY_DN240_c0_g1_i1.p2  ORF type:complete len:347 (+),score=72.67 TRINITY_DN240_c0_g1_i1:40-1041(+)
MKAVLALAFLVAASATTLEAQFGEWKRTFGRTYAAEEHDRRLGYFRANAAKIAELNAAEAHNPVGAVFKLNKFADHSDSELKRLRGLKAVHPSWRNLTATGAAPQIEAPTTVDWRTKGVLAPVQDQGQCGSCWAFSATATLEAQAAIKAGGRPQKLSEQFLVDCDHHCGQYREENGCDAGCNGGLQPNAWLYVISQSGQPSESSYPYQGADGSCQGGTGVTKPSSWEFAPQDEDQMARYLAANGPLSVAVDASNWSFYYGGIMSSSSICPSSSNPWGTLDHGVNIVGYGSDNGTDYWIIRNSWNADWGEQGYCRILRGSNFCGINLFACRAVM